MSIEIESINDELTVFNVIGSISFDEIKEFFESIIKNKKPLTKNVLWDFRKGSLNLVSIEQLECVMNLVEEQGKLRPEDSKTALLSEKTLEYGLSRMISVWSEFNDRIKVEVGVFRELDEAMSFLTKKEIE